MSTATPPILRTDGGSESPRYIVCDFCKCQVTRGSGEHAGGEIVKLSDEARTYRDLQETSSRRIAELENANNAQKTELETLRAENAKLREGNNPPASDTRRESRVGIL